VEVQQRDTDGFLQVRIRLARLQLVNENLGPVIEGALEVIFTTLSGLQLNFHIVPAAPAVNGFDI